MFLTRLKSTASAWKSADARSACSASATRRARSGLTSPDRPSPPRTTSPGKPAVLERRSGRARCAKDSTTLASRAPVAGGIPRAARSASSRASRSPDRCPIELRQIHQDPDDAVHLAPQPERIARSGRASRRPSTDRRNRVELVGQRHRRPRDRRLAELLARRRRIRFDADRQVVVVDGLPDLLGLPFLARVDPAHRPLQLGELEHHVGGRGRPSPGAPRSRHAPAASGRSNTLVGNPARRAARSAPPCRDSCRASCGTRACAGARAATRAVAFRSASQKNFASRSRAVTTRSAFFAISRSSAGCVLTTARNASFSSPRLVDAPGSSADDGRASSSALRAAARGTPRSKKPATTPGNSTRSATSSSSAAWSFRWTRPPSRRAWHLELARDAIAALGVLEDDEVLGQPRLVVVEAADLDRAARRGRSSPGSGGRRSPRRTRRPGPAARRRSAARPIVNGTTRPP